jgi:hypothetical protein
MKSRPPGVSSGSLTATISAESEMIGRQVVPKQPEAHYPQTARYDFALKT